LLSFNSKLSLQKIDMVLIYAEARGAQRLKVSNARTFVNVVQHLRDFGRFEMNKVDLGPQRKD
jgi:hypothetical protein